MNEKLIFPDLILFDDFGGNFSNYINALYEIFNSDFIQSTPIYNERKVSVRKYPEMDGMHKTFYHITHQGENENNRIPDFRRMERIKFPRFVIDNYKHEEILIWKNKRNNEARIVLFNEKENYVLILSERKNDYYLFITAYYIEQEHRKRKLLKEYEIYKKTETV